MMGKSHTDLRSLFFPKAIAVVGASRREDAVGHKIVRSLIENHFPNPIYPVNPNATNILGLKCYPSLHSVGARIDTAVIAVPATRVAGVIDDCHASGVRNIVVISAGFAEVGEEGRRLQQRILESVRHHGMRMVGPNCFGVLNTASAAPMNASFSSFFPIAGKVAMASQSGALGLAAVSMSVEYDLGLSSFVSMGNKADVSSNDLLEYWEDDENTSVILLYLESFGSPMKFSKIARRISHKKPIIALKSGRSVAGQRAASSHTAALATSDTAVTALFRQCGVLRVERLEEMFELARALSSQPLPKGNRVGIITNAGGPAILCADSCESVGLQVPALSGSLQKTLRAFLPAEASVGNPVDLVASAMPLHFGRAVSSVLSSGEVDALVIIYTVIDGELTSALTDAIEAAVAESRAHHNAIPVLFCLIKKRVDNFFLKAGSDRIPIFRFPEQPARVLGQMLSCARWRGKPAETFVEFRDLDLKQAEKILGHKIESSEGLTWLSSEEVRGVLSSVGCPLVPGRLASSEEEAVKIAAEVGYPVVVKLSSREIVHKTDVGGVALNVTDTKGLKSAVSSMRTSILKKFSENAIDGFVVEKMITGGTEIFIGMHRDPLLGPVIAFGLGGIYVEVLSDVTFRVAPLSEQDASEMIREIRGYTILHGYRGKPPVDETALRDLLLRVSSLAEAFPMIKTLDLNPVMALPPGKGSVILDARIGIAH